MKKKKANLVVAMLVTLLPILWSDPVSAEGPTPNITGRAIYIVDGDTIKIDETTIRLWGINTPEKEEPGYESAKQYLKKLLAKETISCRHIELDRWKRVVATCLLHEQDIGRLMVLSGMAKDYTYYSNGYYLDDENLARAARIGLWKTAWRRN